MSDGEGRDRIREARRDDAAEIARLLTPLGYTVSEADVRARWDLWFDEGNVALVAESADGLSGLVTLHRTTVLHRPRPVGRITSLAVDAEAQGRGLGRSLLSAAESALRDLGCGLVEVTSHRRRTEAHAFYRHMDYEETSSRFMREL